MKVTLGQLSHVIGLIHEAGAAPERWPDALAAVMGLLEGSRISLMDIEAGSDRLLAISHLGHDPEHARQYAEHYFDIDPTRALALAAPAFSAMTGYEKFPREVRGRHEYFDWAVQVCNIGDVIGVSTPAVHGQRAILSLQRTPEARPYDVDEKALIELLAPHVQLAKRVQLQLGQAWSGKAELEAAFARLSMAAFIVDGKASIRHLNTAASSLFARSRQAASQHGKLVFRDPKVNAAFQTAVREATSERARSSALAMSLGPRHPAEILISPLSAAHGAVSTWQTPLALVVITDGEPDEESIAWRLQQLYRLTPTESRIAASLAAGQTVEDIAAANRVSEATLRTQLRSIFSKTGTSRQSEVVRLALIGSVLRRDR